MSSPDSAEVDAGGQDGRDRLSDRLGHPFADGSLLELALRHRSWCAEHGGVESNERLEFLGDSVLGLVVTEHLYTSEPDLSEGVLAQRRAELVNARTLADVARDLELGPHIRLGRGEALAGGGGKVSILSDALEAVFGAVYLDGGLEVARPVVLGVLADHIDEVSAGRTRDHKSQLQELVAQRWLDVPDYRISAEGPDHERHFAATASVGGRELGRGEGRTKKQAEQAAAAAALDAIAGGVDPVLGDEDTNHGAPDA